MTNSTHNTSAFKLAWLNQLKRHGVRSALSLALIVLSLLHVSGAWPLKFVDALENFSYDVRLNWLMPNSVSQRVVIVDIDEKSLSELGRWPWGRNQLARLVNTLFDDYQIDTLGFDVVFAEKDESSGLKNLQAIQAQYLPNDTALAATLSQIKPQLDYDLQFANSLKGRNVVLGYYFVESKNAPAIGKLPQPALQSDILIRKPAQLSQATGYGANLPSFQKNALGAGHFNPQPDMDGITRKVAVLTQYQQQFYEALSIAVVRAHLGKAQKQPAALVPQFAKQGTSQHYVGLESFNIQGHRIPVDERMAALVPYRGAQGSFEYVSVADVLNKKVSPSQLNNKIVLIGTTAPGLMDLRATPVQSAYPGVEVHANLIAGILDNSMKAKPAYMLGAEFLMVLMLGLSLLFLLQKLSPVAATIVTVLALLGVLVLSVICWQMAHLVLPIATSLLLVSHLYLLNMSYGFFVESRGKRQLAGIFGQYVPPELVAEMAQNPESISLEGENREMTVLFADIRGFTTIAEQLDPTALTRLLRECLTPLTELIHRNRGTIDKYMGDAIMAFWGAPMLDNNHAKNALTAAMQMRDQVKKISDSLQAKGSSPIQMGFGLSAGPMVVGNMGSQFRMAYTVLGDTVNLGARLESLTKLYGVDIIVNDRIKDLVPEFAYRPLDIVRVKGKETPVAIFEPLGELANISPQLQDELKLYREAMRHYRNQNWDLAEMQLLNLNKLKPQALYDMYIARIAAFRKSPPASNWDGVLNLDSK